MRLGGNQQLIFTTQGNQVIIDSAVIGDATITASKIKDAEITETKIADAAITNAKISGVIKSSTFSDINRTGWMLDKDGGGRFYGPVYAEKLEGDVVNGVLVPGIDSQGVDSRTIKYFASGRYRMAVSIGLNVSFVNTNDATQVNKVQVKVNDSLKKSMIFTSGSGTYGAGRIYIPISFMHQMEVGDTSVTITILANTSAP
ncbi:MULTISPECIES: phage tail tip fiber protein [Symbiopectobacterium]|uniref:phage tail tip fiber protein n=1 Tax=Symbiopectobacterium TaxID=801 RepID=UPI001A24BCDA|nr:MULTISPECIES: hypothetical protein [Symbiopectobacterium]MBG6247025.1 hypothetical protein [Candidatus Symbiopectobacterium sp. PLON1]MBT9429098.1 hypothetical protein [Candidatus Symbiopectobacterium endolongispinus]